MQHPEQDTIVYLLISLYPRQLEVDMSHIVFLQGKKMIWLISSSFRTLYKYSANALSNSIYFLVQQPYKVKLTHCGVYSIILLYYS